MWQEPEKDVDKRQYIDKETKIIHGRHLMVKIERCTKIREEGKRMLCMRHTQANDIRGLWQYLWVY